MSIELGMGINGFGRIGRLTLRAAMCDPLVKIRAINDPFMTIDHMAYLIRFDSVHGKFNGDVSIEGDEKSGKVLVVNGQRISVSALMDANEIPWARNGVEFVAETSGAYTTTERAMHHITGGGARRVVISAPAKDEATPMLVMGVNHTSYNPSTMGIVSNASCTTNCLAPIAKILSDSFGIEEGLMTTIHAVTASQLVVDGACKKDWRAGRSALDNIIPASTGAAKAVGKVIPELKGKLTGMAFRVPTSNVSVVDLTVRLSRPATLDEVAGVVRAAEASYMRGIVGVTEESVVSTDFRGDSRSCVVDLASCILLNPHFLKVVAFYDNEWAYSVRMVSGAAVPFSSQSLVVAGHRLSS